MNNNINVKKLVTNTLSTYGVSDINEASLKSMIAGEGYTIIRFSSMTSTGETQRLLEALYLDEISRYENSFTYNDRERRIVFIRRDISDEEFLYLMAFELGRIKTFSTSSEGVIGTTAEELHLANEFAHYVTDIGKHGLIYNCFKCYPVQFAVSALAFIVCISLVTCFFIIRGCTDDSVYKNTENGAVSSVKTVTVDNKTKAAVETETFTPTNYVRTGSGKKYHTEDCGHVSGKNVLVVCREDIDSGKYEPCSRCIKQN